MEKSRQIKILELLLGYMTYGHLGMCGVLIDLCKEGYIDRYDRDYMIGFLKENKPNNNPRFEFYMDNEYWRNDHYWWKPISKAKPGTLVVRQVYLQELIKYLKNG